MLPGRLAALPVLHRDDLFSEGVQVGCYLPYASVDRRKALNGAIMSLILLGSACTPREGAGTSRPLAGDAAVADRSSAPPLSLNAGTWPAELAADTRWLQAADGDEWAALLLARSYAAFELIERIAGGGPAAKAAILAYPTAEQAWVMRGRLCQLLPAYEPDAWAVMLQAVARASEQADSFGEQLEPQAASDCARVLDAIERRVLQGPLPDGTRSEALSATLDHVRSARQALDHFDRGKM